jgi:hypothetical protein
MGSAIYITFISVSGLSCFETNVALKILMFDPNWKKKYLASVLKNSLVNVTHKQNRNHGTHQIGSNPEGRWRKFSYKEIIAKEKTNLDVIWLKDKKETPQKQDPLQYCT